MRAAAGGLHQGERDVVARVKQLAARPGQPGQGVGGAGAVGALHFAGLEILEQLGPDELALADDHRVHVLQRLVRQGGGVHAAHHHGHALLAEAVGDLVGARRHRRLAGETNQPRLGIEVDNLLLFVYNLDIVRGRRHRRNIGQVEKPQLEDEILVGTTFAEG